MLVDTVIDCLESMEFTIDRISYLRLNNYTKRFIPYMLAHMTYYLEQGCDDPDAGIVKYIEYNKKNNNDIEHVLANDFESNKEFFNDENDFESYRSWFGNLILLPADKNRSIQDQSFTEKLKTYYGENLMAKTFCRDFYKNNPRFNRFIQEHGLDYRPLDSFAKSEIVYRQELYRKTANEIWNVDVIRKLSKE